MPTLPTAELPEQDPEHEIIVLDLDKLPVEHNVSSSLAIVNDAAGAAVRNLQAFQMNLPTSFVAQIVENNKRMLEAHTRMMESLQPMQGFMASVQQIGAQVAAMTQSVIGSGVLEMARQAHERTAGMLKALAQHLRLPSYVGLIQQSLASFTNLFSNTWSQLLQPIIEFWRRYRASNIQLIVRASEGDEIATHTLGKMWWRLWSKFKDFKQEQGEDANWEDFCNTISVTCWEVLQEEENGHRFSLLHLAAIIFNRLRYQLVRDRIVIIDSHEGSAISVYIDENANIPAGYFTKSLARQAEVTPETIRSWIRSGQLKAIKIPYQLQSLGREVKAYLILDEPGMMTELYAVKREMATRQRHQRAGLYTVAQVTKEYGVSRRTLQRWDETGILSPQRIKGYRYYTQAEVASVPGILVKNDSPKIRALMASGRPSPA